MSLYYQDELVSEAYCEIIAKRLSNQTDCLRFWRFPTMSDLKQALGRIPYLGEAACVGNQEVFDVPPGLGLREMQQRQDRALAVCYACPVLAECARWTVRDPHADVWAQGGIRMFDIPTQRQQRHRDAIQKRNRRMEPEAQKIRDEAKSLLAKWGNHDR